MASEERANVAARRAESSVASLTPQLRQLEDERNQLRRDLDDSHQRIAHTEQKLAASPDLTDQLQALQDQVEDLQAELDDTKEREGKARAHYLAELTEAQNEAVALKTKLRQAERARGKVPA